MALEQKEWQTRFFNKYSLATLASVLTAPSGYRFELIDERHTSFVIKWRNDPRLNRHFMSQEILTEEKQRLFLEHYRDKDRLDFVLVDHSRNKPIGVFGVKNISSQPELGQLIGEGAYQGKGLGKKATQALLRFLFSRLELKVIYARVKENNSINLNLLKQLQFSVEKSEFIHDEVYRVLKLSREEVSL